MIHLCQIVENQEPPHRTLEEKQHRQSKAIDSFTPGASSHWWLKPKDMGSSLSTVWSLNLRGSHKLEEPMEQALAIGVRL